MNPLHLQENGNPKRLNVLVLDGGGVRGFSSLIILEALLEKVREYAHLEQSHVLKPHEVFQLVVGTSTGGLSGLMIGKLGMSVQDSIEEYPTISKSIFKDGRHLRGKFSKGVLLPRYCGKRFGKTVEKLFRSKNADCNHPMSGRSDDFTHCAVVCKDHRAARRNDHQPIIICSLKCTEHFDCTVCEAARATSAAPFYFSPQEIDSEPETKLLIDGGFGVNNPSRAVYDHFFRRDEVSENPHPDLDWDSLNFVNLGTGTPPKIDQSSKRVRVKQKILRVKSRLPKSLQQSLETMVTIKTLTTDSEIAASQMRALAISFSSAIDLRYDRFSATTGVHEIKMDKYEKLNVIREKTDLYLEEIGQIGGAFDVSARLLARDYLARRNRSTA
ncbi:hypothetical protein MMC07_007943 [Pseudocyphellaria aurata]|nr:hypothetical protein [Pseudocyphellaria aurata]